jgi:molybdopterin converting factor small subunit
MSMINILLFGVIKDMAGSNGIMLNEVNDTNELVAKLQAMFPRLTGAEYIIAVDRNIIQENTVLGPNAEVALLPPFSGG